MSEYGEAANLDQSNPTLSENTNPIEPLGGDVVQSETQEDADVEETSTERSSDEEDNELTTGDIKPDIRNALDTVKSVGDFACLGRPQYLVDPHLCIGSDSRPILLPLQADGAARIAAAAHQASFGRGSETIINRDVRNTWEINADQITMHNGEAFQTMVSGEVLPFVSKSLGLAGRSIGAELYKLLLYEPGAHFKPHTE